MLCVQPAQSSRNIVIFPSLDLYKRGAGRGSDIPCDLAGDSALYASHSYWANLEVADISATMSVCDKAY